MEDVWTSIVEPSGIPITPQQLLEFESDLGFPIPEDYRDFLLNVNGGKIVLEHDIYVEDLGCDVFVNYLWPLTAKSPDLGIKEGRDIQVRQRLGLRQALAIGDDMGTGFFYLVLDGQQRGSIYFGFREDILEREADWYSPAVSIPEGMVRVSSDFNALGRAILDHKV